MGLFELRKKLLAKQIAAEKKRQSIKMDRLKKQAAKANELAMLQAEVNKLRQMNTKGLTKAEKEFLMKKKQQVAKRKAQIKKGFQTTGKVFSSILDDIEKASKPPRKVRKKRKAPVKRRKSRK